MARWSMGPLSIALAACSGSPAPEAAPSAPPTPQSMCTGLNGRVFTTPDGNATITATQMVAASGDQPEHCLVRGSMPSALQFEARLPNEWNQRLLYLGGGGFDGAVPPLLGYQFAQGYVVVGSNGGHVAAADETWVYDNEKLVDYAHRSVHKTLGAVRQIIQQRYGRLPARSYFEGCSNGGREALIQAQRYPQDFDGILARAPASHFTPLLLAGNRIYKQVHATPGGQLPANKIALLGAATTNACDMLDNGPDRIISNPFACRFDPATLRCPGGDAPNCLTDAQIATVNTLYSPFRFANGAAYYIGWPRGGEADPFGWPAWIAKQDDGLPSFSTRFVQYFLLHDATANPATFVPENHLPVIAERAALLDASSTDYSAFRNRGGKLILWHGTNDWATSFTQTALYYNEIVAAAGGQAQADQFVEFFPAPGVQHCFGGPGQDFVDLLTPLRNWVENGAVPSQQNLVSVKIDFQALRITSARPLCKFPQYPRYVSGDLNLQTSYTCVAN